MLLEPVGLIGSFSLHFAFLLHACTGFIQVPNFLPTRHACSDSKLAGGVDFSVKGPLDFHAFDGLALCPGCTLPLALAKYLLGQAPITHPPV